MERLRHKGDPNGDLEKVLRGEMDAPEWLLRYTAENVYHSRSAHRTSLAAVAGLIVMLLILTPVSIVVVKNSVGRNELCQAIGDLVEVNVDGIESEIRLTKPIPPKVYRQFKVTKKEALKVSKDNRQKLLDIACGGQIQNGKSE